jgi:hypothetical protein
MYTVILYATMIALLHTAAMAGQWRSSGHPCEGETSGGRRARDREVQSTAEAGFQQDIQSESNDFVQQQVLVLRFKTLKP